MWVKGLKIGKTAKSPNFGWNCNFHLIVTSTIFVRNFLKYLYKLDEILRNVCLWCFSEVSTDFEKTELKIVRTMISKSQCCTNNSEGGSECAQVSNDTRGHQNIPGEGDVFLSQLFGALLPTGFLSPEPAQQLLRPDQLLLTQVHLVLQVYLQSHTRTSMLHTCCIHLESTWKMHTKLCTNSETNIKRNIYFWINAWIFTGGNNMVTWLQKLFQNHSKTLFLLP